MIAPALVTQFDGDAVARECAKQLDEGVARRRRILEAGGELGEEGAKLAGGGERFDAGAELIEVGLVWASDGVEQLAVTGFLEGEARVGLGQPS